MKHLHQSVHSKLLLSDKDRIRAIREDRFIYHKRAKVILNEMEDLLDHPFSSRMRCLLIYGDSGNGKTMLLKKFAEKYLPEVHDDRDYLHAPVFYISSPSRASESAFYEKILQTCLAEYKPNHRVEQKRHLAFNLLSKLGTRVLLVDELNQLLHGSAMQQINMLNILKSINNELQICIVGAGTREAYHAIGNDVQMSRRFLPRPLITFKYKDKSYLEVLKTFEVLLPLKKPSNLIDKDVAKCIIDLSHGSIAEIVMLIQEAAIDAILTGQECIDFESINKAKYLSPVQRRTFQTVEGAVRENKY